MTAAARLLALCCLTFFLIGSRAQAAESTRVLATTYPVYLFARGLGEALENVHIELLLPAQAGCPHDYALSPRELQRLAQADILIMNGLGLESFILTHLRRSYPDLPVVDASQGVDALLPAGHHHAGHDHRDHAHEANPHIFASPRMAAHMVRSMGSQLAGLLPEQGRSISENADASASRLEALAAILERRAEGLRVHTVIMQHDSLDYLARDLGLDVAAVVQEHSSQEPSAARMLKLVRLAKRTGAAAIFAEPQFPSETCRLLTRETGLPLGFLDSVATGPEDPEPGYYEAVMLRNIQVLEDTLGRK